MGFESEIFRFAYPVRYTFDTFNRYALTIKYMWYDAIQNTPAWLRSNVTTNKKIYMIWVYGVWVYVSWVVDMT